MRRYKVMLPLVVHTADASYGQHEEFDHEFTAADETTNLASGLLELVPRRYRVVGPNVVHDTEPGDTFEAALPMGVEEHLIVSGNVELVCDEPEPRAEPAPPKKRARSASPKEK